jgi:hypothetical protein
MQRGWTLQELLAPRLVDFYDTNWNKIGSKATLSEVLSQITGISCTALQGAQLGAFTVADRMSWAARRTTTRAEDMSYCLLGIFGVNMPLLYGEGEERSFLRLQEEILKICEDYTIFAWSDDEAYDTVRGHCAGLLASSVNKFDGFSASQGLYPGPFLTMKHSDLVKSDEASYPDEPPTLTSRGLRITLLISKSEGTYSERQNIFHAQFHCLVRVSRRELLTKPMILHLERCGGGSNLYRRISPGPRGLSTMEIHEHKPSTFFASTIYVKQERQFTVSAMTSSLRSRELAVFDLSFENVEMLDAAVPKKIDEQSGRNGNLILLEDASATGCDVVLLVRHGTNFAMVAAGFSNGRPWCQVKGVKKSCVIRDQPIIHCITRKRRHAMSTENESEEEEKDIDKDRVIRGELYDWLQAAASLVQNDETEKSHSATLVLPFGAQFTSVVERHPRRLVRMDFMPIPEWGEVFSLSTTYQLPQHMEEQSKDGNINNQRRLRPRQERKDYRGW